MKSDSILAYFAVAVLFLAAFASGSITPPWLSWLVFGAAMALCAYAARVMAKEW